MFYEMALAILIFSREVAKEFEVAFLANKRAVTFKVGVLDLVLIIINLLTSRFQLFSRPGGGYFFTFMEIIK